MFQLLKKRGLPVLLIVINFLVLGAFTYNASAASFCNLLKEKPNLIEVSNARAIRLNLAHEGRNLKGQTVSIYFKEEAKRQPIINAKVIEQVFTEYREGVFVKESVSMILKEGRKEIELDTEGFSKIDAVVVSVKSTWAAKLYELNTRDWIEFPLEPSFRLPIDLSVDSSNQMESAKNFSIGKVVSLLTFPPLSQNRNAVEKTKVVEGILISFPQYYSYDRDYVIRNKDGQEVNVPQENVRRWKVSPE